MNFEMNFDLEHRDAETQSITLTSGSVAKQKSLCLCVSVFI